MSAVGQVVRSVSIPTFSRLATIKPDRNFAALVGPVWAVSLLAGLLLSVLAHLVIELVYGPRWLPAAAVLAWLGVFGSLRTLFDLSASYLLARGASKATLLVQIAWIVALIPAVVLGLRANGSPGVAAAHLATAVLVVCPAYALSLRRTGADLRAVGAKLWPPVVAALPAGAASMAVEAVMPGPLWGLLAGGSVCVSVYALLLARWFRRQIREAKQLTNQQDPTAPAAGQPVRKHITKLKEVT